VSVVAPRVATVKARIEAACRRAKRDPEDVAILAVSKTVPAEVVREVVSLVEAIGENRVQEAVAKRPIVGGGLPWHLIGPLQRNKAKQALEVFDLVESVDRTEIADRLEQLLSGSTRVMPVFLEVNIGNEPQKSGASIEQTGSLARHILECCPHLQLRGLMTVPPFGPSPELSRPYFARLRDLADGTARELGLGRLELSMGMSDDFEVAVEEGATWVRLGRALFGAR
jgi:PLP dependent protein